MTGASKQGQGELERTLSLAIGQDINGGQAAIQTKNKIRTRVSALGMPVVVVPKHISDESSAVPIRRSRSDSNPSSWNHPASQKTTESMKSIKID